MAQFETHSSAPRVTVWDLGVRLFHWSLVSMVVLTYLFDEPRKLHRGMGYVVIILIAFRLIWDLWAANIHGSPTSSLVLPDCSDICAICCVAARRAILVITLLEPL
jgi:Ni,Fe-hydrogenase I cytochrome b subunit